MAGRGAWSRVGKDNNSPYYQYIVDKPLDGSRQGLDTAHLALWLGVRAIQTRINAEGYSPTLREDGYLGPTTAKGIVWYQQKNKLKADGQVGPTTARQMWRQTVQEAAETAKIDPALLWGQMLHESVGDPSACGYTHEEDRGLVQINTASTNVSIAQAHDPYFALDYSANRLRQAWDKYSKKGTEVQLACTIYQHNTPVGADTWYRTGKPPSQQAQNYVDSVLTLMRTWVPMS